MRESRTLDQRRAQQRLKHMENEVMNLTKQLSLAQMQIEASFKKKTIADVGDYKMTDRF